MFLLPFLALAGFPSRVSAQAVALQVQIYDNAGLSPAALSQFVSRTREILTIAGLSVEVDACGKGVLACEHPNKDARQAVIRVQPGRAKDTRNTPWLRLGESIADHHGGTYATIFLQAAGNQAADYNLPRITVLAYAAVHEVGHLLLGDQAHTPSGLMKADWGRSEFGQMSENQLRFTKQQAAELCQRYGARVQAAPDIGTAVAARESSYGICVSQTAGRHWDKSISSLSPPTVRSSDVWL